MKKLLLLSVFALTACTMPSQQPAHMPVTVTIENGTVQPAAAPTGQTQTSQTSATNQTTQTTEYVVTPAYTIQDDYFGPTYGTMAEVQYAQQPGVAYETRTYAEQYQSVYGNTVPQLMYTQNARQNPTAIQNTGLITGQNQSTQAAALQNQSTQTVTGQNQNTQATVPQNQNINPYYPYAGTQPVQNQMGAGSVVVLQHPMTRELVRCDFTDYNCIGSYESQGYVQLRAAPHFAGSNDIPSDTDYPPRRYRDNNNIPRW